MTETIYIGRVQFTLGGSFLHLEGHLYICRVNLTNHLVVNVTFGVHRHRRNTVDGQIPAPPKKPWNDDSHKQIPANNGKSSSIHSMSQVAPRFLSAFWSPNSGRVELETRPSRMLEFASLRKARRMQTNAPAEICGQK